MGQTVCARRRGAPRTWCSPAAPTRRSTRRSPTCSPDADVVVDFTSPTPRSPTRWSASRAGVHVVIGTTGFDPEPLRGAERARNVFIAPNFAIGAVLMMRFAAEAAAALPEGRDHRAASRPQARRARAAPRRAPQQLMAADRTARSRSTRCACPGLVAHQEVIFGGLGETLTIRHDSLSRESFMPGVLLAVRRVGTLDRVAGRRARAPAVSGDCACARRRAGLRAERSPASTSAPGTTATRLPRRARLADRTVRFAAARWSEILGGDGSETWVLEVAGRIAGYATVGPARDEDAGAGIGELWRSTSTRRAQGAGAGRGCSPTPIARLRGARLRRRDALGLQRERPRAALLRAARLALDDAARRPSRWSAGRRRSDAPCATGSAEPGAPDARRGHRPRGRCATASASQARSTRAPRSPGACAAPSMPAASARSRPRARPPRAGRSTCTIRRPRARLRLPPRTRLRRARRRHALGARGRRGSAARPAPLHRRRPPPQPGSLRGLKERSRASGVERLDHRVPPARGVRPDRRGGRVLDDDRRAVAV